MCSKHVLGVNFQESVMDLETESMKKRKWRDDTLELYSLSDNKSNAKLPYYTRINIKHILSRG